MWKRHRRYATDGTCNTVLATLLGHAQASGRIGWEVPVDAAINRAHPPGTNLLRRPDHHDPLTGRRLAAPGDAPNGPWPPKPPPSRGKRKLLRKRKGSAGGRPVSHDKEA
ncbi:MAG: hypothetical protein WCC45_15115 [Paeniglutamicibacter sp.]